MERQTNSSAQQRGNDGGHGLFRWLKMHTAQISESFWFCLALLLFVLMGPFSAIAVLIGLGSLGSEQNRMQMKEPVRL